MTERFIVDDCGTLIDMQTRDTFDYVSDVCDLLNKQHETIQRLQKNITELLCVDIEEELLKENEQLKTDNGAFIQDIEVFKEENTHLKLENEELKQFKEDVFNKIDMHLRMLPTARDNEFNEDDGDPSLYCGAIYMLETLKKELE